MTQNIKSFKVYCLPLTKIKQKKLEDMINEYALFYNYSAKLQPSLPDKYRDKPKKGDVGLYGKWVKSNIIPRNHIGAKEAFIAIGDACANYKTSKQLCDNPSCSVMDKPNIIKFDGGNYKIIKLNNYYGIQLKFKDNNIYFPLKTGTYEKLNQYLELNIGKDVGQIVYNLRDNSISIPFKSISEKFKKKEELKTFIGVDLGINNIAVISAISVDISEVKKITTELYKSGKKDISFNDIPVKVLKVKVLSGFGNNHKMKQLKKLENKRRKLRKDVGNRRNDLRDHTNHYISAEITKFAFKFENPIVIFEKGLANLVKSKNSTWSPADVKSKAEYKLNSKGIWISEVYPHNTSQICHKCGAIGTRPKGTVYFSCPSCGLGVGSNPTSTIGQYNADVNASINIALRGLYILTRKGKLLDIKKASLKSLDVPPNDNAQIVVATTQGVDEALDGTRQRKHTECVEPVKITSVISERISTSNLQVSGQPMVEIHQMNCVPENGFSSFYKQKNNFAGRTELLEETVISEVLSQSKF